LLLASVNVVNTAAGQDSVCSTENKAVADLLTVSSTDRGREFSRCRHLETRQETPFRPTSDTATISASGRSVTASGRL